MKNREKFTSAELMEFTPDEMADFDRDDLNYFLAGAVSGLDIPLVNKLLTCGADPNICGSGGIESLLHGLAYQYGSQRTLCGEDILIVAEALLKAGADPNITGSNNRTPIQVCDMVVADPLAKLLLAYGADPEGNPVI